MKIILKLCIFWLAAILAGLPIQWAKAMTVPEVVGTGQMVSGGWLYSACQANGSFGNAATESGYCLGYAAGVADAASFIEYNAWLNGRIQRSVCAPDGVTSDQVRDIIIRALETHPEQRHLPAGTLGIWALRAAFPCP